MKLDLTPDRLKAAQDTVRHVKETAKAAAAVSDVPRDVATEVVTLPVDEVLGTNEGGPSRIEGPVDSELEAALARLAAPAVVSDEVINTQLSEQDVADLRSELAKNIELVAALTTLTEEQDAFIAALEAKLAAGVSTKELLAAIRNAKDN